MKHLQSGSLLDAVPVLSTGSEGPASSRGTLTDYDHRLSKHLPLPESSIAQEHLMGLLCLLTSKSLRQRQGSGPKGNIFSKVTAPHKKL